MKNKKIFLLLVTSVFALLVFIVLSCGKEPTCFSASDREECKKKCKVKFFSAERKYSYNDANKECCCNQ